jgi:hypothetical protein
VLMTSLPSASGIHRAGNLSSSSSATVSWAADSGWAYRAMDQIPTRPRLILPAIAPRATPQSTGLRVPSMPAFGAAFATRSGTTAVSAAGSQ